MQPDSLVRQGGNLKFWDSGILARCAGGDDTSFSGFSISRRVGVITELLGSGLLRTFAGRLAMN